MAGLVTVVEVLVGVLTLALVAYDALGMLVVLVWVGICGEHW